MTPDTADMGGPPILVVDDSPTMRGMLQRALGGAGYEVILASDGCEALQRLAHTPVRLILTDINMPRMDGVAFIAAVRRDPRHARTPILALTTEAEADAKAAGKAAGATGWMVKPFEPGRLCEVVQAVLGPRTRDAAGPPET
ncbi:MAG: response regulator [Candidatus Methylomirabilales bacterium]